MKPELEATSAGTQPKQARSTAEKGEVEIYRKASRANQLFSCATSIFSPEALLSHEQLQFPAAELITQVIFLSSEEACL